MNQSNLIPVRLVIFNEVKRKAIRIDRSEYLQQICRKWQHKSGLEEYMPGSTYFHTEFLHTIIGAKRFHY